MLDAISVFINEEQNFIIYSGPGGDVIFRPPEEVWLLSPDGDDVKVPVNFLSLAILYISIPEVV